MCTATPNYYNTVAQGRLKRRTAPIPASLGNNKVLALTPTQIEAKQGGNHIHSYIAGDHIHHRPPLRRKSLDFARFSYPLPMSESYPSLYLTIISFQCPTNSRCMLVVSFWLAIRERNRQIDKVGI
jgi:hypothetical protein